MAVKGWFPEGKEGARIFGVIGVVWVAEPKEE
jgi:hypothetical protein